MKFTSRLLCGFSVLVMMAPMPIYADDTLVIDDYISDHAQIVDESTEKELNELGYQLEQKTGAQVVFITENTLNGQDIRQITYRTFKKYQLGDKDKDNGILFVVSLQDKLRYMEVGRGLEGVITDIDSQHLQTDYLVPYFQKEDYSTGIEKLYKETVNAIASNTETSSSEESEGSIQWIMLLPIFGILLVFLLYAFQRRNRTDSVLYMKPGQTLRLNVHGYDFDHENILISSQDESIVSVQANGLIHAHQIGKTKVLLQKLNEKYQHWITISVLSHDDNARQEQEDNSLVEALFWGSMLSSGRRRRRFGGFGGGFGSGGGFGGFSGGGGGSSRGGGAGGSW